jgi:uncharacterized SAM-binding protein YcdF (DUF218 family)
VNLVLTVLKQIGGPGAIGFLAVGCAVGLFIIHVWPRRRALGRWWLFGLYASYLVLGLPIVAHSIASPFATVRPSPTLDGTERVDVLMVFGGDNSVGRVSETLRAWQAFAPSVVIVSGEDWFLERLSQAGVPSNRIIHDTESGTTREQVAYVERYLAKHPDTRMAIVASRLQVPRIDALLRVARVRATVLPSPADRELPERGVRVFVPTYAALRITRDAFYERVALAYYRRQGWIE